MVREVDVHVEEPKRARVYMRVAAAAEAHRGLKERAEREIERREASLASRSELGHESEMHLQYPLSLCSIYTI